MAAGVSSAVADGWLNVIKGTTYTGVSACYAKLHTNAGSDLGPGAAGTANASVETTRKAITWNSSITSNTLSATTPSPSWTSWPSGATGEVISWVSVWDAATNGNFLFSGKLAVSKTLTTGDTLTLSTLSVNVPPAS